MKDHKIAVSTPVADARIRGTEFWAGPLEKYGVLLLEGAACPIRREVSC